MAETYYLSEINPNDTAGGGGCACSEIYDRDSKGPFAVFPGTETNSNISPHVVVCVGCVKSILGRVKDGTEVLSAGEKGAAKD